MSERGDLFNNDAVWARFYRDGKNLGEICAEFSCGIYDLSPWLTAPLVRAELAPGHEEDVRAEVNRLRGMIEEAQHCLDGEPEYHDQGMGCGLEDRGITDRYDAMHHGWEQAMERVYGENIAWAKDVLTSALSKQESTDAP